MKYFVSTDTRGYVLNIVHTGTIKDYVELNLDEYDLTKKRAYKLGKNKLIFDEEEWNKITTEQEKEKDFKEVDELKSFLYETDYITSRAFEEILSLTNPITWVADVIKINIKYTKMYAETLTERVKARNRIEEIYDKWGRN
jgi:hypothetical protein